MISSCILILKSIKNYCEKKAGNINDDIILLMLSLRGKIMSVIIYYFQPGRLDCRLSILVSIFLRPLYFSYVASSDRTGSKRSTLAPSMMYNLAILIVYTRLYHRCRSINIVKNSGMIGWKNDKRAVDGTTKRGLIFIGRNLCTYSNITVRHNNHARYF